MAEASGAGAGIARAVAVVVIVVGVLAGGAYVIERLEWRNPPDDYTLRQNLRAEKAKRTMAEMAKSSTEDLDKALASASPAAAPPAVSTTPPSPAKAKGVARAPSATDCWKWPGTVYVAGKGCRAVESTAHYQAVAAGNSTLNSCAGRARGSAVTLDVPRNDGTGAVDRITSTC